MSRVRIEYSDIAVGAKENFQPYSDDESIFSDINQIKEDINFANYGNPAEMFSVILDGSVAPFPSVKTGEEVFGFISEDVADENGYLYTVIDLKSQDGESFSSSGITLKFDTDKGIYPEHILVEWRSEGVGDSVFFYPDDAIYFCEHTVENFDEVTIYFLKMNVPHTRLKLTGIEFGSLIVFKDELRHVEASQKINEISAELPISTCDFVVDIERGSLKKFVEGNPLNLIWGNELKMKAFVSSAKKQGKTRWSVKTEDAIGRMDKVTYFGGIYSEEKASVIIRDIFATANMECNISSQLDDVLLSGHLPIGTCRSALQQVLFASCAVVRTENVENAKISHLTDYIYHEIPLSRQKPQQTIDEVSPVTDIEIVEHEFVLGDEVVKAYKSEDGDIGTDVFIKFSEPLHNLVISGNGEIRESNPNYAVVHASEKGVVLSGNKYHHVKKTKRINLDDTRKKRENVVKIENATLVSASNIDNVSNMCYNHYIKNKKISANIIEGRYDSSTGVGECINIQTEYDGIFNGRICEQKYHLNGNILVKKTVII